MKMNCLTFSLCRFVSARILVVGVATMILSLSLYAETNVKDFGAVGDGLANDTVAIQNALNAVAQLWFPVGTYKITAPLSIDRSILVRGENAIIAPTGAFCAFELGDPSYLTNLNLGYYEVTMSNLRINQASGGTGILNQGIRTIRLNGVTVFGGETALDTEGSWRLSSAQNCRFHSQTGNAVELRQRNNLFSFLQSSFLGAGGNGVRATTVDAELKNITFLQCDFEGNHGAIQILGNTGGVNLTSCWFESNSVFNVCIDNNTGNKYAITIQGCQITGNNVDVIIGNNNSGNTIDGCTISSNEFADSKLIIATGAGVVLNTAVLGNNFSNPANMLLPPAGSIVSKNLGAYMPLPLYPNNAYVPWGSGDTKGINGEVRYDSTYLYMRTANGWRRVALGSF
jgi:hypothetical protein